MDTDLLLQIQALVDAMKQIGIDFKGNGGWTLLGVAGVIVGALRVWRFDLVQRGIASLHAAITRRWPVLGARTAWLVWANLTDLGKNLYPVIIAAVAAVAAVATGKVTWIAAVLGLIAVWFGSETTHATTKWVGSKLTPITARLPRPVRAGISIVAPIDKSRLPKPPA